MLNNCQVAVHVQKGCYYSDIAPYNAPHGYPEYQFKNSYDNKNHVYESVRNCFHMLGLDAENFGKANWNPLGLIINPGETVVIKPNMIAHSHKYKDDWEYVITHGSVIRAVLDYVYIALRGKGRIVIADAPQEDSHIELIKQRVGIEAIQEFYWREKRFEVEFLDLRYRYITGKDGICLDEVRLKGDPLGSVRVNLEKHSYFSEHDGLNKRYYGSFYDIEETNRHHSNGVHEYMVSRSVLEADVFISVPKLKTHKKVGVTLNLKGLVGINSSKNWLPHYAIGSPEENGDQFPAKSLRTKFENNLVLLAKKMLLNKIPLVQLAARKLKPLGYRIFGDTEKVIRSGNWFGNDTCWRMVLDLNRILLYAATDGKLRSSVKRYFSVVDGIIGMDGDGPVTGNPKPAGLIVAGCNPAAVDVVCASLMGFDYCKIPMLYRAFDKSSYPLAKFYPDDISVISNKGELQAALQTLSQSHFLDFEPHFGWKGHIESGRC
jgi:uncharacterized protein (DUF362 family)